MHRPKESSLRAPSRCSKSSGKPGGYQQRALPPSHLIFIPVTLQCPFQKNEGRLLSAIAPNTWVLKLRPRAGKMGAPGRNPAPLTSFKLAPRPPQGS